MSTYTYETEDKACSLETYEWDNVWWDHPENTVSPRVLYIGDSISCGTRKVINPLANGRILVDHFGTSKSLDNPYFKDSLRLFGKQQNGRKAVLFNNGLHGWHLRDELEYAEQYEKMVQFLLTEFPDVPLILVLTTHLTDSTRNMRVRARNAVACAIAEKYRLRVLDFYKLSLAHTDQMLDDGVHFQLEGYEAFAHAMIDFLNPIVKM